MRQMLRSKFWIVVVLCAVLTLSCEETFAKGGRGRGGGGGRGNRGRGFQGRRGSYYYRGGGWYRHGWLGGNILFSALAIGALVDSLPPRYTTVVYSGVPYYYYDGYYYRPYPSGGYVIVQPPVETPPVAVAPEVAPAAVAAPAPVAAAPVAQPQAQTQLPETLIVNIPNSKAGYTKVTLKKSGNGFTGPQGEYYEGHPTVEQLKVLYGKQ